MHQKNPKKPNKKKEKSMSNSDMVGNCKKKKVPRKPNKKDDVMW